jgi:hypothetical protein
MRILYHRISGAIGLTDHESGTRGAWVEKRRNVLRWLHGRSHQMCIATRLTKATVAAPPEDYWYAQPEHPDLIVLEFGPSNGSWYAEDYTRTQELLAEHPGVPVAYLCDDPDLLKPSVCRYVPQDDWSRWTFLLNCQSPGLAPEVLGAPEEAAYREFNPGVGLPQDEYNESAAAGAERLVYPGRPGGRKVQCAEMVASGVVEIMGSAAEWAAYHVPVVASPQQAERRAAYRRYLGVVCAFDRTHAVLGWRTGRAYHALAAGVPVLTFPGNPALWWGMQVSDCSTLGHLASALLDEGFRRSIVRDQRNAVSSDETDLFGYAAIHTLGL